MDYRTIPGTDLKVSLLAFGNFVFGTNWWGDFTDEEGIALQNQAFDLGVNFFDTAPAYGNGRSENLLAETIKYAGRDNLVISTKFGYDFYSDPGEEGGHRERKQDFSPKMIRFELEQSLERMGIDCVDLYQAHNIKQAQFADESFAELEKLVDEGKIRAWGTALGPAIGWREEGYDSFDRGAATVQTVMNMYEQDPGREFCQYAAQLGKGGVIARVPTNSGVLDDEFDSPDHQFPPQDHRKFRDKNWLIYGLKKNEIMRPIAESIGCNLPQLAFKWLASWPTMVSIEPNLLRIEQVREFAEAADGNYLSDELFNQIEQMYNNDFDMGDDAHPCDWKSSVTEDGKIRSAYEPLPSLKHVAG